MGKSNTQKAHKFTAEKMVDVVEHNAPEMAVAVQKLQS